MNVNINTVEANPFNPRKGLDEDLTRQLVQEIKSNRFWKTQFLGRKVGKKIELAFGAHRLEACKQAGINVIDVELKNLSDTDMRAMALKENMTRKSLEPIEEAEALCKLVEDYNKLYKDDVQALKKASEEIGMKPEELRLKTSLLKLPKDIQAMIDKGSTYKSRALDENKLISVTVAQSLATLEDPKEIQDIVRTQIHPDTRARSFSKALTMYKKADAVTKRRVRHGEIDIHLAEHFDTLEQKGAIDALKKIDERTATDFMNEVLTRGVQFGQVLLHFRMSGKLKNCSKYQLAMIYRELKSDFETHWKPFLEELEREIAVPESLEVV